MNKLKLNNNTQQEETSKLFEKHQFLVKNTIYKTLKNPIGIAKSNKLELDDLYQYGNEALWKACLEYTPNKSKFQTFAINRIKWALLDALNTECQFIQYDKRKNFTSKTKHRVTSIDTKSNMQDLDMYEVIEDESISQLHNEEDLQYDFYLSKLSDRQKLITKLKVDGSSIIEIAEKLNVSRQAIYLELDNIKEKLKGVLTV